MKCPKCKSHIFFPFKIILAGSRHSALKCGKCHLRLYRELDAQFFIMILLYGISYGLGIYFRSFFWMLVLIAVSAFIDAYTVKLK